MPKLNNIKLIVTDLDNTLLKQDSTLPDEFYVTYEKLKDAGIPLVLASGRPYQSVLSMFGDLLDDMTVITDNGALIIENKEELVCDELKKEDYKRLVDFTMDETPCVPILCKLGPGPSYTDKRYEKYKEDLSRYFDQLEYIDLKGFETKAGKFSIYCPDEDSAKQYDEKYAPNFKDLDVTPADAKFVDVMNPGINKGKALHFLKDRYGIGDDEVLIFGDTLNDKEMLSQTRYSFMVENGDEKLREFVNYTAPSNEERGVLQIIEQMLEDKNN